MKVRSPWRKLLYEELEKLALQGKVIDLGGSRNSAYSKNFEKEAELTVANLDDDDTKDIFLNLEEPFEIKDGSYDGVLCINVLEHIYNYQNVIGETMRILKPGGQVIFAVPFLIQVHPSPHDHWRFTKETLERIFTDNGFTSVKVKAIGTGVFGATAQIKSNLLHFSFLRVIDQTIARILDYGLSKVSKSVIYKGDMYSKEFYPLGYIVTAGKKHS